MEKQFKSEKREPTFNIIVRVIPHPGYSTRPNFLEFTDLFVSTVNFNFADLASLLIQFLADR